MVVQSTVALAVSLSQQFNRPTSVAAPSHDATCSSRGSDRGIRAPMGPKKSNPLDEGDSHERMRVFFGGGFLARNPMAQRLIAKSFNKLSGSPALFLRHSDFLGAL